MVLYHSKGRNKVKEGQRNTVLVSFLSTTHRERAKKRREEKKFYKKHSLPDIAGDIDYEEEGKSVDIEEPTDYLHSVGLYKASRKEDEAAFFDSEDYYYHYKRTKRNIGDTLQWLISMPKQGHATTISGGHDVIINEVKLNKACTVVHVWWNITTPLIDNDSQVVLADIQRRLTKARGYLAGKLVALLGLRFAPDIRFYIDKSDKEYLEFLARLEHTTSSNEKSKQILEEIKILKSWGPERIEAVKSLIKDDKEREKFEKVVSRANLEKTEKAVEMLGKAEEKMKEEFKNTPKITKRKQKRLDEITKVKETVLRQQGLNPEKILNTKEEDIEDIGDEFLAAYEHKIPNPRRAKKIDSEGKRVRKHPRDENGKKIRTKNKKGKAEKFWANINQIQQQKGNNGNKQTVINNPLQGGYLHILL
eukprot:TRINITY_DN105430_c0_g1_i1.p2 TRINITY_DN105430_c0_g1~~TRINITY_DN105430_c0_g1_i1.p2  ORF type:complete len:420 (+),score=55.62 TRINITY_DN105430_c0_g1_i1:771-2030(+)